MNSDKEVKFETEKLVYGLLIVCSLGALLYFFGSGFAHFVYDVFGVALTSTDLEIIFVLSVIVCVKVAYSKISKKYVEEER